MFFLFFTIEFQGYENKVVLIDNGEGAQVGAQNKDIYDVSQADLTRVNFCLWQKLLKF